MKRWFRHKYFKRSLLAAALLFLCWFLFFSLPATPFRVPYSKVMYSADGYLLNAQVAKDQQWRFPPGAGISPQFEKCILTFEDKGFYRHPGISPSGIGRALLQNIRRRKVVSGGSTITMQTIRLMKQNPPRTFREKILEMMLAVRLEMRYSKKDILALYATHAPFGNNVVGVEAASWRYFGKKTTELSWAENALLAVLPNAPGLLYPGKNHDRLMQKRNRLLAMLLQEKVIDTTTYNLSVAEPVPDKPLPVPNLAWHYFSSKGSDKGIRYSSLQYRLQDQCQRMADRYARQNHDNQVQSAAIIISDVHTGKILAYVGNTDAQWNPQTSFVDCADAPRSSGSVLKPLLYYESLKAGLIAPRSMLFDVPVSYNHFTPQNYARSYEGLISAHDALVKSLNIPMVGLLQDYGLAKFHARLQRDGFRHLNRSSSHYGLSLILGSGEITLGELNAVYNRWAHSLLDTLQPAFDPACVYETMETMTQLNRPDENGNWKAFANTQKIAWKTGTSFGNRDAWSVGISADYVVTVWIGNADGTGRPNLTGIGYAAPLLFDLFDALPKSCKWFPNPVAGYGKIVLCSASGYKAGPYCETTDTVSLPLSCEQVAVCPFHHPLTVNEEGTMRVTAAVYDWRRIQQRNYFILPPVVVNYYRSWNPGFRVPPPWHPGVSEATQHLRIVFPDKTTLLSFSPTGNMNVHFKAMTETRNTVLYWHVDDTYIGSTTQIHELEYNLPPGEHRLSIVDENGNTQQTVFHISKAG